jgi:predicted nucleic acid-binding protein
MSAEALLDSNVLLYAVSNHPSERKKREQARALLASPGVGFSTQVFSEFYDNATRKHEPRLTHAQAVAILEPLRLLPVQPFTSDVLWDAFRLTHRFQLRFWDGAILAAARALGCRIVWSEDLNDGQQYDGVRVCDPFKAIH